MIQNKKTIEEHTKEFTILFELKPGKIKEIFYVQNINASVVKQSSLMFIHAYSHCLRL